MTRRMVTPGRSNCPACKAGRLSPCRASPGVIRAAPERVAQGEVVIWQQREEGRPAFRAGRHAVASSYVSAGRARTRQRAARLFDQGPGAGVEKCRSSVEAGFDTSQHRNRLPINGLSRTGPIVSSVERLACVKPPGVSRRCPRSTEILCVRHSTLCRASDATGCRMVNSGGKKCRTGLRHFFDTSARPCGWDAPDPAAYKSLEARCVSSAGGPFEQEASPGVGPCGEPRAGVEWRPPVPGRWPQRGPACSGKIPSRAQRPAPVYA
jgi:hypothetical protein